MADQIRVLVVDDIPETRDHLTKLLGFESDIDVVGAAASGREALEMAARLIPDVVLMDINMPDMDGIAATEQLVVGRARRGGRDDVRPGRGRLPAPLDARRRARVPGQAVQQRRAHRLDPTGQRSRARQAEPDGGQPCRPRPAPPTTGRDRANRASPASIVAIFSPKGGVGRTTVAVNLAVAAATELGKKVVIMDGSFQFGDVGVLLNLNPKSKSIADLIPELEAGELDSIDTFLINHTAGIRVLLAPPSPGDGRDDHRRRASRRSSNASAPTTTSSSSTAPPTSTTRRWPSSTPPM